MASSSQKWHCHVFLLLLLTIAASMSVARGNGSYDFGTRGTSRVLLQNAVVPRAEATFATTPTPDGGLTMQGNLDSPFINGGAAAVLTVNGAHDGTLTLQGNVTSAVIKGAGAGVLAINGAIGVVGTGGFDLTIAGIIFKLNGLVNNDAKGTTIVGNLTIAGIRLDGSVTLGGANVVKVDGNASVSGIVGVEGNIAIGSDGIVGDCTIRVAGVTIVRLGGTVDSQHVIKDVYVNLFGMPIIKGILSTAISAALTAALKAAVAAISIGAPS